jgi:uncharacterized membrane protein
MTMTNLHVLAGAGETAEDFAVHKIGLADLRDSLREGIDDFWAMPSHYVFLALIYPIIGVFLVALTSNRNALPLLYPLLSGFALIGPLAAIGLYEMSRRRELGKEASWQNIFDVWRSPAMPSILALGFILMVIFLGWLVTAEQLYERLVGPAAPESLRLLFIQIVTTPSGWALIALGNLVGLAFAVVVLSISVVAFPLLLDQDVGVAAAVRTSVKVVRTNPGMMALWGLIVAGALVIGMAPAMIGLAIVMPILAHATWHLYRRVIGHPLNGAPARQGAKSAL